MHVPPGIPSGSFLRAACSCTQAHYGSGARKWSNRVPVGCDKYIIPTPPPNATSAMIARADDPIVFWKECLVRRSKPEFGEYQNYRAAGTGVFRDFGRRFVGGVPAAFLIEANAVDRRSTRLVTSS